MDVIDDDDIYTDENRDRHSDKNINREMDKNTDKHTEKSFTEDVLHKAEVMRFNNGWNDKNEAILISVGENAASYKWMHEKCAGHQKNIYKFMSISLIILSTTLTAETIFPDSSQDGVFDILRRVFLYIVNVLTVLQTFLKCEETSERHLAASGGFSNLYHEIQQQMCMFRRDRTNATKYVGDCLKQYDSLVINSPDISSRVLRSFKQTFKNSNIAVPEIADRIQKIEIITEDVENGGSNQIQIQSLNANQLEQQRQKHIEKKVKRKGVSLINGNGNSSNVCNLSQIHNAFQIHGDITDRDLENINSVELRELRTRFLQQKSDYEYQRFLQHSREDE